jgi:hypothetical protein
MSQLSPFESGIATPKSKNYKSPGINQISTEIIQAG